MMPVDCLALVATGTANGDAIPVPNAFAMSFQYTATGTLAGTLKVQFSNDTYQPNSKIAPTNWTDIPSATSSVVAATGSGLAKIDLCYNWIRIVMTASGGTGTVSVRIKANAY